MTVNEALNKAAAHFLSNYISENKGISLLNDYAKFELGYPSEKASVFAKAVVANSNMFSKSPKEKERFFSWYYINFVVGHGDGGISLESAIDSALKHFSVNQELHLEVYQKYAKEEIRLNDEAAVNYATKQLNLEPVDQSLDTEEFSNFFLWYYINCAAI
jgi:hypothetical protein